MSLSRTYGLDSKFWYIPEDSMSAKIMRLFFPLQPDESTQQFLDHSAEISSNVFWQTVRNLGVMFLSSVYSKTDVNGMLGFGNMFLFSEKQISTFLNIDQEKWSANNKNVLDLGAGNGDITQHLRPLFENIYATELSSAMRKRLEEKQIKVLDALKWQETDVKFDLITAFNLLDRHYSPKSLLRDLWKVAKKSNCNVIISLVLPISPFVEFNPNGSGNRPDQWLNVTGWTYCDHVQKLIENEFEPANFEVVRWTRLPYLCEGDMHYPAYYLPDAMFLLKPVDEAEKPIKHQIDINGPKVELPVHAEL